MIPSLPIEVSTYDRVILRVRKVRQRLLALERASATWWPLTVWPERRARSNADKRCLSTLETKRLYLSNSFLPQRLSILGVETDLGIYEVTKATLSWNL